MSETGEPDARVRDGSPVPGTVRLMTSRPVEMPLAAAGGQSSLGETIGERPWLVPIGIATGLAVVGFAVILGRRLAS